MVTRLVDGKYVIAQEPKPQMPDDLAKLFDGGGALMAIDTEPDRLHSSGAADRAHRTQDLVMRLWRGDASGGRFMEYRLPPKKARSSSTSSTASRRPRRPTSPCGGTARPASAALAAPRSTAGRRSCA